MHSLRTVLVGVAFALLSAACGGGSGGGDGSVVGVGTGDGTPPASGQTMSAAEVDFALQVLALTNQVRQQAGVPVLSWDGGATQVAFEHCLYQRSQGQIGHTGAGGSQPWDRLTDAGIGWSAVAENVARGQPTPESVVQAWVGSPGHYANMINAGYTHLGVGCELGAGGPWWTQVFYRP